jgi:hypothetical protein
MALVPECRRFELAAFIDRPSIAISGTCRARKPWISLLKLAPIRKATDAKWNKDTRGPDRIGREDWEVGSGPGTHFFRRQDPFCNARNRFAALDCRNPALAESLSLNLRTTDKSFSSCARVAMPGSKKP